AVLAGSAAQASPWAEVGDAQLRGDIEILAAAHVIDGITTHWPLPWTSLVARLQHADLGGQPAYVQAAARRVRAAADYQTRSFQFSATVDATNTPNVVRGFDGMARETVEGQLSGEFVGSSTAVRLSLGGLVQNHTGVAEFVPDRSYIAQR